MPATTKESGMVKHVRQLMPLFTTREWSVIQASFDKRQADVSAELVRQRIVLARKLRDKYRDESQRQRRESRGKATPRGTTAAQSNDNTVTKKKVFAAVLKAFEEQLAALPADKPKAKAKTKAKRKPVTRAATKRALRRKLAR